MNILEILKGKKSYLAGGLMVILGILTFFAPNLIAFLGIEDATTLIGTGLGIMALRAGIKKAE